MHSSEYFCEWHCTGRGKFSFGILWDAWGFMESVLEFPNHPQPKENQLLSEGRRRGGGTRRFLTILHRRPKGRKGFSKIHPISNQLEPNWNEPEEKSPREEESDQQQQCRWPRSLTGGDSLEINSNYRFRQLVSESIVKLSHPESVSPCVSFFLFLSLSFSFFLFLSFSLFLSLSVSARSAPPTSSISPARVTRERKRGKEREREG